jgi:hypothetical protein
VLLSLLLTVATPPRVTAGEASDTRALTPEQWREDLRYFSAQLQKRHKNVFHTVSREVFERAVADLDAAIPSLEDHQILVRLAQLAAMVGDGHTRVQLARDFHRYPILLYWFGEDLRVIAVAGKEYERALGARVVAIGGMPIDQVMSRVVTCFPCAEAENDWYVLNTSPAYISLPEVLHALGVVPEVEKARFLLRDDEGEEIELELPAVAVTPGAPQQFRRPAATEPLTRQRPGERFWFTWLPDSKTVYVNFRGYEKLGEKARELFAFVDANPVERLVIDMRQNGGGDFFEGRKNLIKPIEQRPKINQKGKLFVAVGRSTFSAAMVNAIDFRKDTQAILVGEPIGERPNSYSENDEMTLPNSKIVASYSTRYYQFVEQDVPAVEPDRRIDPSWESYRTGRDPVMDWILAGAPD